MNFERSWVEINLDNFAYNLQQLKGLLRAKTEFMQIVKADAYGHGAYEIAKESTKQGATYLGVANSEEGILLRYQNITTPILILSPSYEDEIDQIIEYNLTPTITTLQFARELDSKSNGQPIKVHIEIDTGMGRSGIRYDEANKIIPEIQSLTNLSIEGIFSHFCCSETDSDYNKLQSERFDKVVKELSFTPRYIHIANSSGVITCNPEYTNLVRLGLLSYGVYPGNGLLDKIDIKAVMSFKSTVCQIKKANKGESIGYNRTYIAQDNIDYAIIPVGYADGYDYLLSNRGEVLVNGQYCPVIGKISMDMLTIDVSNVRNIKVGDEVTLLNSGLLSPQNVTAKYDGLSYELLCQIGRRAKRYYLSNGSTIATAPLARREFVSHDFSDSKLNLIIESAISQRLQSKEIASLLYSEILRRFFVDRDRDIHYRKNFCYKIEFTKPKEPMHKEFYEVETTLSFTKVLQQDHFFVACAHRLEDLQRYFRRRDVEYRWLLDSNFNLTEDFFSVSNVSINDLTLNHHSEISDGCMEIRCSHPMLSELVDKIVDFSISMKTYYPKASHQLSAYITEITQGVSVSFHYPEDEIKDVEVVNIFSGQQKYPVTVRENGVISISTGEEEWIFPNSGIIFAY